MLFTKHIVETFNRALARSEIEVRLINELKIDLTKTRL